MLPRMIKRAVSRVKRTQVTLRSPIWFASHSRALAATALFTTMTGVAMCARPQEEEEEMVAFNKAHFGESLNGRFDQTDAVDFFAGANGGKGRFEDPELRDIAAAQPAIIKVLREHGLQAGATVVDVGAGTGLFLHALNREVGPEGSVVAVDVAAKFVGHMRERIAVERLGAVSVFLCTNKDVGVPKGTNGDVALICDVYHHFEYPKTYMRSLHSALRPGGHVILIDFYRDPSKMTSHPPQWALDHLRASKEVYQAEIESCGFELVCVPEVKELTENYVMVFRRK